MRGGDAGAALQHHFLGFAAGEQAGEFGAQRGGGFEGAVRVDVHFPEAVERADLKRDPENPRSLFGLAESLRAEGKTQEAAHVQQRFSKEWSHADVTLAPENLAAQ